MTTPKFITPGERVPVSSLGEAEIDFINVLSTINGGNPPSTTIRALLRMAIKTAIPSIEKRVQYLADKRGITYQEMWKTIVTGGYEPLPTEAGWDDIDID